MGDGREGGDWEGRKGWVGGGKRVRVGRVRMGRVGMGLMLYLDLRQFTNEILVQQGICLFHKSIIARSCAAPKKFTTACFLWCPNGFSPFQRANPPNDPMRSK